MQHELAVKGSLRSSLRYIITMIIMFCTAKVNVMMGLKSHFVCPLILLCILFLQVDQVDLVIPMETAESNIFIDC